MKINHVDSKNAVKNNFNQHWEKFEANYSHPLHDIACMLMPVTRWGVVLTIEYCVDFKI